MLPSIVSYRRGNCKLRDAGAAGWLALAIGQVTPVAPAPPSVHTGPRRDREEAANIHILPTCGTAMAFDYVDKDGRLMTRQKVHLLPAEALWLYDKTRDRLLLDRTRNAIAMMMDAYPDQRRCRLGRLVDRSRLDAGLDPHRVGLARTGDEPLGSEQAQPGGQALGQMPKTDAPRRGARRLAAELAAA